MTQSWRRTEKADLATDPLTVDYVRDQHLRVTNGTLEDDFIRRALRSSLDRAQAVTKRRLLPETWQLIVSRFPCGTDPLILDKGPVRSVPSITYVDEDGVTQTMGSPSIWALDNPSIDTNKKASIILEPDEEWPTTRAQWNAVILTLELGYPDTDTTPAVADIPEDITLGRLVMIGELYKQRSESVHAINHTPAMIRARDLWMQHKLY